MGWEDHKAPPTCADVSSDLRSRRKGTANDTARGANVGPQYFDPPSSPSAQEIHSTQNPVNDSWALGVYQAASMRSGGRQ